MTKSVLIDGKRHRLVEDLGFNGRLGLYGVIAIRNGSPDIAVKKPQGTYEWYHPITSGEDTENA